ncbi:MAG: PilZ domain-containing protein [Terriglobales bacterium]
MAAPGVPGGWPKTRAALCRSTSVETEATLTATRERRLHTRYAVSGAAYVKTMDGGGGRWAKLGDLSLSGCYLQTPEPMEVGSSLSLLVKVTGQEFETAAIVRSCCPGIGMGLEFTFLRSSDGSTLRCVIARLKELDTVPG